MPLASEIALNYIKGVGPQRAETLAVELGLHTVQDLLDHFPFRYIDRSKFARIADLQPDMPAVQLRGYLREVVKEGVGTKSRLKVIFDDGSGYVELVWFQGVNWIFPTLKHGVEYVVFGKPSLFKSSLSISHPEIEPFESFQLSKREGVEPVYNTTEKMKAKRMDSRALLKIVRTVFLNLPPIPENLPESLIRKHRLMPRPEAYRQIHFPQSPDLAEAARRRFKFEELFFLQLELVARKQFRYRTSKGNRFEKVGDLFNNFYTKQLPFELTGAQKRVVKEIRIDTATGKQMNRLVQGDVGSGKTIVALLSMILAADNGFQSCMMAPTEILAIQHFNGISKLLEGFPLNVALLTGSTKKSERTKLLEALKAGELHILVGTHALIEDPVVFHNLGLAVIDEQHRFGVEQRARLWKKAAIPPHVLVMTATPIPRTLAMTLYGDLDVSVIDELPKGRKPIKTVHQTDAHRLRVFGFMREQIALGRQVYVVYPMIEESENSDLKFLMDGYESISRAFPLPDFQISIVHGKMKPAEKDYEMKRFKDGITNIMVATTVIEVGVDVPNASVMVIENSERFGLSQLHQLRGRVGRGAEQSFCILMTGNKLSNDGKVRIKTMVDTTDGFKISEVDLKLRGPGELSGLRQSGVVDLKIASLVEDGPLIQEVRETVLEMVSSDPPSDELKIALAQLNAKKRGVKDWSDVS